MLSAKSINAVIKNFTIFLVLIMLIRPSHCKLYYTLIVFLLSHRIVSWNMLDEYSAMALMDARNWKIHKYLCGTLQRHTRTLDLSWTKSAWFISRRECNSFSRVRLCMLNARIYEQYYAQYYIPISWYYEACAKRGCKRRNRDCVTCGKWTRKNYEHVGANARPSSRNNAFDYSTVETI